MAKRHNLYNLSTKSTSQKPFFSELQKAPNSARSDPRSRGHFRYELYRHRMEVNAQERSIDLKKEAQICNAIAEQLRKARKVSNG